VIFTSISDEIQTLNLEKISPLDLAAHYNHEEIIDYLLQYNIGKFFMKK